MPEDVVVKSPTPSSANEAAEAAADAYAPDEFEKHAQAIMNAWEVKLTELTKAARPEAGGPIGPGIYKWWDLLIAGPFQFIAPGGPFAPSKIIRAGQPAFMLSALWRNPAPIGGMGPSAAQVLNGQQYRIQGEVINLSTVSDGPDLPVTNGTFAGGFLNFNVHFIPATFFPIPPEGKPHLYQLEMTADIVTAAPGGPPFASYATWVLDPDFDPPFLGRPGIPPQWQLDIPAKFLVYQ